MCGTCRCMLWLYLLNLKWSCWRCLHVHMHTHYKKGKRLTLVFHCTSNATITSHHCEKVALKVGPLTRLTDMALCATFIVRCIIVSLSVFFLSVWCNHSEEFYRHCCELKIYMYMYLYVPEDVYTIAYLSVFTDWKCRLPQVIIYYPLLFLSTCGDLSFSTFSDEGFWPVFCTHYMSILPEGNRHTTQTPHRHCYIQVLCTADSSNMWAVS